MMVGRRSFPFGTRPIFTGKLAVKVPGCNITNARGSQLGFGKKIMEHTPTLKCRR